MPLSKSPLIETLCIERSLVFLIDIQTRLAPVISAAQEIEANARWVLELAQQLDVPVLATQQYPQGLGETLASLQDFISPHALHDKIHFSAMRETHIVEALVTTGRDQLVILGTEAHVCVLQTVLDLALAGYQIFVIEEAVGSRYERDKSLALTRMQQAGAQIISREMLAFEWLARADSAMFKHISRGWIK